MSVLVNPQAKQPRTQRSYAVELACWASLWVVNGCHMAAHFHTMSFMTAASAVMCLFIAPALMWQALEGLRRETNE